jgi:hypothetical protein
MSLQGHDPLKVGLPSVSVPVLSTTSVSTLRSTSIASAFLNSTPRVAPLPVATMIDIGVASPSAQGHAMMSTATALISACAIFGSGPTLAHATNVASDTKMTVGTKYPATTSARFWIGARLRWASATIATMRASNFRASSSSSQSEGQRTQTEFLGARTDRWKRNPV